MVVKKRVTSEDLSVQGRPSLASGFHGSNILSKTRLYNEKLNALEESLNGKISEHSFFSKQQKHLHPVEKEKVDEKGKLIS